MKKLNLSIVIPTRNRADMLNKTLEETVGVHKSNKWGRLRVLEEKGLIELRVNGTGKAPEAKIIVPSLH